MPVEPLVPTGNVFLDTIEPLTDPTLPPPTSQINGSASGVNVPDGVGNPDVPTNAERADALFPFFDGVNERLSTNPISQDGLTEYLFPGTTPTLTPAADANGNPLTQEQLFQNAIPIPPDPADLPVQDFFGFHSSHQLEYVLQFGDPVPGSDDARIVTFEQDGNRFDVVAIPGERRVFTLQQLTKADLAIIAPETEQALGLAIASERIPDNLRTQIESVIGATSGPEAEAALDTIIRDARNQVNEFFSASGAVDFSAAEIDEFRDVFTDQIDNIETRAAQSSFFALDEIRTRIDEILRRAERANEFFVVVQNPPEPRGRITVNLELDLFTLDDFPVDTPGQNLNVNAPAGDDLSQSGIRGAFDTFIAQETRIRDLDNQRLQLAQTGTLGGGRALDGPNLIAIFQLNYNLTREAEVNAETEELNQQNALLQVYAAVQQLVNDALREFGTGEDGAEEERDITGSEDAGLFRDLTATQQNLVAFIEDLLVRDSTVSHPIESLRGINRPTLDVIVNGEGANLDGRFENGEFTAEFRLNRFSQNELNIFASQLADTVTQINQESQILTNEISSINRERNRNFDLANNALRRLNDTLLTIARA
ncbi:MAG: hypothetical protein AAF754_19315 [Pseudomonadota bacterium]